MSDFPNATSLLASINSLLFSSDSHLSSLNSLLFWTYLAIGPGAWLIAAYLMKVGRERMTKLRNSKSVLPDAPPLISILIPAKDEGARIRACVERAMQQDYPAFEVIAINDRSSDDTGKVLDEIAARFPLPLREGPGEGWLAGSEVAGDSELPPSLPSPSRGEEDSPLPLREGVGGGVAGGFAGHGEFAASPHPAISPPLEGGAGGGVAGGFIGHGELAASPHPALPLKGGGIKTIHIADLPPGWLGKCHALDQGARDAKGEWFFFVDSDVQLQPEALSKMAALAIERNYDALSIATAIETEYFVERLMLPLLAATWATMFAADQTNEDSQPDRAVANGQVFLIRADAYRKVGGHAAVKDRIVEDVELMRAFKKAGFKTRFLAGRHLARTRMHTHLRQMFHGWARIFIGTARGRIAPMIGAILFLFLSVLSVYPAIGHGIAAHDFRWFIASIAHWLLMTILLALVWIWTGNSPAYALLLPISAPIEIALLVFSIRRAINGKVEWRGASLDLRRTSEVQSESREQRSAR